MSRKQKRAKGGPPSTRQVRVAELLRQELGRLLSDSRTLRDPRLSETMVTVTEVRISPDLAYAKVYVSIFSDDPEVKTKAIEGLGAAAGRLQRQVGGAIKLKETPRLQFVLDESLAEGARIEALLHEINDQK